MKSEILHYYGHVRLSYNPYFSACFFSRNSIFLSQQISRNSVSACFFSEANGAVYILFFSSRREKGVVVWQYISRIRMESVPALWLRTDDKINKTSSAAVAYATHASTSCPASSNFHPGDWPSPAPGARWGTVTRCDATQQKRRACRVTAHERAGPTPLSLARSLALCASSTYGCTGQEGVQRLSAYRQ